MRIASLVAVSTWFVLFSQAHADDSIKHQILQAAQALESELLDSTASENSLKEALRNVENARRLVAGQGGDPQTRKQCIDFAYSKYRTNHSSDVAMDKAGESCRGVDDIAVLKFLFEKHHTSHSSSDSMDEAAQGAKGVAGKLNIVTFSFSKYHTNHSSSDAATKASDGAKKVGVEALECLVPAFERYHTNHSSSDAMDKAFNACRE